MCTLNSWRFLSAPFSGEHATDTGYGFGITAPAYRHARTGTSLGAGGAPERLQSRLHILDQQEGTRLIHLRQMRHQSGGGPLFEGLRHEFVPVPRGLEIKIRDKLLELRARQGKTTDKTSK